MMGWVICCFGCVFVFFVVLVIIFVLVRIGDDVNGKLLELVEVDELFDVDIFG